VRIIGSRSETFPQYEGAYIATACIPDRREWLKRLWVAYKPYADDNFLIELKSSGKFNERTWEMYLASVFLSQNFTLNQKSAEGPDLHLSLGGKDIWIEAIAPGLGEVDPAAERPVLTPGVLYSRGGDMEVMNRPKILRLTAAVSTKREAYKRNLGKGIIKENEPYVIAVNGFTFLGLVSDVDYLVRRSFFASGCVSLPRLPDGTLGAPTVLYEPTVDKQTPNGIVVKVPTDIFTNGNCKEISAVIFSPDHIVASIRDQESMGNNLMLVRNPFAQNPLPEDFRLPGRECVLEGTLISYHS
jgi:hypothetical protein